jgi:aspartyl-tRNA(Asn)/glutamyl-tRNA(Gln) amidotransferase subunit A
MSEVTSLPAAALAAAIRERRFSAAEVVEAYLARAARVDDEVRGYVTVLPERARHQARQRDAVLSAGGTVGALHGVPVAIKDLMTIEGVPMTAGSSFLGRVPAQETATVVRRLEMAGAVVLGTTTLHEFAFGMTSVNRHGRWPRNPWRLDRVCGGSSGGSAAVVAAGMAPCAVGSDTGGSIRIPAAFCGIVGLKPTYSRVSRHGVLPLASTFDTVGPMTRTVEDAALMLEVMAGADRLDPHASTEPVPSYRGQMRVDPAGLSVGRLRGEYFEADLDPAAARGLDDVSRVLQGLGIRVRDVEIRDMDTVQQAQLAILGSEAAAFHRAAFPGRESEYAADVRANLDRGAAISAAEIDGAREVMGRTKREVEARLAEMPILLSPMIAIGAPAISDADPDGPKWPELRRMVGRFTRLFNLTGLPTISLPVGLTAEGLPVAVQLAAGAFAEGLLLSVARRVESAVEWSLPELPRF